MYHIVVPQMNRLRSNNSSQGIVATKSISSGVNSSIDNVKGKKMSGIRSEIKIFQQKSHKKMPSLLVDEA